jgi:hypothetical protein
LGANHPTTIDCISRLQSLGGNAGSVAPSQSAAVAGSNPDPRAFAAAGQKDSSSSVSVQQSVQAVVTAPESDIADAEQSGSAAAAVVPSTLHPDAALADGAVLGNEEEMIAASSADANVENTSGSSPGDAPTVAEIVAAAGDDGPNPVDDSAAAASVDDAVVPTESASDEIVAVADADAPHPADDSAAVDSAVVPTESASDEIVAAQSTNEEIARDDDNTPAVLAADSTASLADATSDVPSSESAPAVDEGDVAAAVELPVTEPDGTAERASASASIEQSDS